MINLPDYKSIDIKKNDKLVICVHRGAKSFRKVTGRVYQITDNFIILQCENYKESFNRVDFFTGDAKIISLNGANIQ